MSKPVALILNDTSNAYHWGCYGTSSELRLSLEELGYRVTRFGVADLHTLKTPPANDAHMTDVGFRRAFLYDNPKLNASLSEADVVVVNGEGTLHGLSQAALNLLYVSNLSKTEFQKTVYLVNSSLYPCDWAPLDENTGRFYQAMLSPLDKIVLREPLSHQISHEIGLDADLGFDCLARHLERKDFQHSDSSAGAIVLGGGLGLPPLFFADFLNACDSRLNGCPLVYVTGAPGHVAQDDARVVEALRENGLDIEHQTLAALEDWVSMLMNATCLISGRFHHSIAAAYLGTPTVTFRAATPKNDGLSQSLGFSAPVDSLAEDAIQVGLERVTDAIEQRQPTLSDDRRSSVLELSAKNFEGL